MCSKSKCGIWCEGDVRFIELSWEFDVVFEVNLIIYCIIIKWVM